MFVDFSPLRKYRDYRLIFIGQSISTLGTMISYVALPYQVYKVTGSSMAVGLVGVVQLVPLLFTALIGGAYADVLDRRKLIIWAELVLSLCALVLALNALSDTPQVWLIYVVAAVGSAATGFHRPAFSAMIPRLIPREDMAAVSALNSMVGTACSVAGPALGGIVMASMGISAAFFANVASFGVSLVVLYFLKPMPSNAEKKTVGLSNIFEGLKYARSRQELMGTYVVDFVAMVFGMPTALFPAWSEAYGGAAVVGYLYSAPSFGAMLASITSKWTEKVHRQGAAVIIAAGVWGVAIVAFGFATNLWLALFFLTLAGGADMISAIFRMTMWNNTIPDKLRGRLAGVEMISYMSGPLLGNTESGLVAAVTSTQFSIVSGGAACILGVVLCGLFLPKFWSFDYQKWLSENPDHGSQ
jgi:MFS family permease